MPIQTLCTTCGRPSDDGYVNVAAEEACMDACHGRTSRQHTVAVAYNALCSQAEQLGVPTSLDDPASPITVDELQAAVDSARVVYMQATTGKLHRRQNCSITSRTRYSHFPVEFTAERAVECERCQKCWDGFKPVTS